MPSPLQAPYLGYSISCAGWLLLFCKPHYLSPFKPPTVYSRAMCWIDTASVLRLTPKLLLNSLNRSCIASTLLTWSMIRPAEPRLFVARLHASLARLHLPSTFEWHPEICSHFSAWLVRRGPPHHRHFRTHFKTSEYLYFLVGVTWLEMTIAFICGKYLIVAAKLLNHGSQTTESRQPNYWKLPPPFDHLQNRGKANAQRQGNVALFCK